MKDLVCILLNECINGLMDSDLQSDQTHALILFQ